LEGLKRYEKTTTHEQVVSHGSQFRGSGGGAYWVPATDGRRSATKKLFVH